jgi:spore coat polysaccharide biosynthesis protein SpsF
VVLTSDRAVDDPIASLARHAGVDLFRGDAGNVALRILQAIRALDVEHFIRINGDTPFIDRDLLRTGISLQEEGKYEIISNIIERTHPYGSSLELLSASKFEGTYPLFSEPDHFEHPTSFYYQTIENFRHLSIVHHDNRHDVRLTIDTLDDYLRIQQLLEYDRDFANRSLEEKISIYDAFMADHTPSAADQMGNLTT